MALKVYGHDGRPLVAFPSQDGRYWDFEAWGMIDACAGLIDAGRVRIVAVDGIDWQSWTNHALVARGPGAAPRRLRPLPRRPRSCRSSTRIPAGSGPGRPGASMGGYHAANVVFRHPDLFDGLHRAVRPVPARPVRGRRPERGGLLQQPAALPAQPRRPVVPGPAPRREARLRRRPGRVGGRHARRHAGAATTSCAAKGIPAIVDYWGNDVNHDWPWWRQMLPHYLERLGV